MSVRRLRKFIGCTPEERALLSEATLLLGLSRAALLALPFKRIAPWLGEHMRERGGAPPADREALLETLSWVIPAAARQVPWKAQCFPQAITAKVMLGRRGVPSTLYLGVGKSGGASKLRAHAWLEAGERIVTGGATRHEYTIISSFA